MIHLHGAHNKLHQIQISHLGAWGVWDSLNDELLGFSKKIIFNVHIKYLYHVSVITQSGIEIKSLKLSFGDIFR